MKISKNFEWVKLENECMVVNSQTNQNYHLNETSTFIWDLILENKKIDEIIMECSNYCSDDDLEEQIDNFISELIELKIIEE